MEGERKPPVITPELLIVLSMLEAERDRHGTEWCRKHGVGSVRRLLGREFPPNVAVMPVFGSPEVTGFLLAQRTAQAVLVAHCRLCAGCKLGKE